MKYLKLYEDYISISPPGHDNIHYDEDQRTKIELNESKISIRDLSMIPGDGTKLIKKINKEGDYEYENNDKMKDEQYKKGFTRAMFVATNVVRKEFGLGIPKK